MTNNKGRILRALPQSFETAMDPSSSECTFYGVEMRVLNTVDPIEDAIMKGILAVLGPKGNPNV